VTDMLTPVLTALWTSPAPSPWTATRTTGLAGAAQALALEPDALMAKVKDASLRGRGGPASRPG